MIFLISVLNFALNRIIGNHQEDVLLFDYGVSSKADYLFLIHGQNLSGTILLFADDTNNDRILSAPFKKLCLSPQSISTKFHTITTQKSIYSYNGTLYDHGIYRIHVLNCKHVSFNIKARIHNHNTHLDSRELHIPHLYVVLTFLYPTFTLFWIINSLTHPKFFVFIHLMLTLSTMVKALSLVFVTNYWISKSLYENPPMSIRLYSEFLTLFANTFLFSINGLAGIGLNSFRQAVSFKEMCKVVFIVSSFFVLRLILDYTGSQRYDFPFIMLMLINTFIFIQIFSNGIRTALRLISRYEHIPHNHTVYSKMLLVLKFGSYLLIWMLLTYVFGVYIYLVSTVKVVKVAVEEIIYVTVSILDMKFFMLKNEYEPLNNDEPTPIQDQTSAVVLDEPQNQIFVFLTNGD